MELKDFVSQTLTHIFEGVHNAQKAASDHGGKVNPNFWTISKSTFIGTTGESGGRDQPILMIEFDVAISASDETQSKGGLGIFVGSIGIGGQGSSNSANSQLSRIKFSVPIALPPHQ